MVAVKVGWLIRGGVLGKRRDGYWSRPGRSDPYHCLLRPQQAVNITQGAWVTAPLMILSRQIFAFGKPRQCHLVHAK